eukprot:GHRQ01009899.1.p2 GENE.GHRQ01009899.1~~GHRQ01009899.1.p2  ORF type:complete len:363 (+),score=86.88 GHRQ01009899.1:277-1365(+)
MAHVDVRAHLSRISAAKRAVEELRVDVASCKLATLREDSNAVADEAVELLREIEAQALHPDCNLLPETIGRAALKAEDSLRVLQGKVATADRESKGSFFAKLGKQLVNPHKKIFKEARDGLAAARAAMTKEDVDALTSDEDADPYQQLPQQQPAAQACPSEVQLSWERGVRVSTVALTPRQDGTAASPTLLVALNRKVELYPGCSREAKTEVQLTNKVRRQACGDRHATCMWLMRWSVWALCLHVHWWGVHVCGLRCHSTGLPGVACGGEQSGGCAGINSFTLAMSGGRCDTSRGRQQGWWAQPSRAVLMWRFKAGQASSSLKAGPVIQLMRVCLTAGQLLKPAQVWWRYPIQGLWCWVCLA